MIDKADIVHVDEAVRAIRDALPARPVLGLVLGSGLGDFADGLEGATVLQTSSIPHYPVSTVPGHKGRLVFATLDGTPLLAFQGRLHYYECRSVPTVLFPIMVAHGLGIRTLIITNAAGGVNRTFAPGDLMLIRDQINLTFEGITWTRTPVRGSDVFDRTLMRIAAGAAARTGIPLREGVYAGMKGPSYETAAEVEMVHRIGGDAVGMSTVIETALGAQFGMRILGISCITNHATGISDQKLSHAEVTEVGNRVKSGFARLLRDIIANLPKEYTSD
jgi:purine-nucleoside phosphorylase